MEREFAVHIIISSAERSTLISPGKFGKICGVSGVLLPATLLVPRLAFFRVIVAPGGRLVSPAGGVPSRRALRSRQPRKHGELLALFRTRPRIPARQRARAGVQRADLPRPHFDGRPHGAHQQLHRAAAPIERRVRLRVKFMSRNLDALVGLLRLGDRGGGRDRQRVLGA